MLLKKSPNYMRRNEFSRDTFYLFHQQSAQQMGEKKRKKSDKYVESVQRVLITQGEEIEKTGGKYQYKFVCVKNKNCHFHCARMSPNKNKYGNWRNCTENEQFVHVAQVSAHLKQQTRYSHLILHQPVVGGANHSTIVIVVRTPHVTHTRPREHLKKMVKIDENVHFSQYSKLLQHSK